MVPTPQDPGNLAVELYTNNVIVRATREQVTQITLTRAQKNTQLLAAVESQICVNPTAFDVFLCALRKQTNLDALCREIDQAYCKCSFLQSFKSVNHKIILKMHTQVNSVVLSFPPVNHLLDHPWFQPLNLSQSPPVKTL